ncbi:MAG: TlpA family protein disulfide reductase [Flavobacterium sp.]|nr:TlpA family protein disulfide reductase [Flavobacterium sp.]
MKKLIMLLAVAFGTVSCNSQKKEFSSEALNGKLTNLDGKEVTFQSVIDANKGKTVVVEIWASWCGDCVKAMPKMKELQASNPNVAYVFISMDKTADKWKTGIEKHDLKGQHFWVNDESGMKGSFGKSIDLDWIPRYIVINKKGKVVLYRAIETDFDKINIEITK